MSSEKPTTLDEALKGLSREAKNTITLAVKNEFVAPPLNRLTISGTDEDPLISMGGFHPYAGDIELDRDKIDRMMKTGQIAYPMLMKKAPVISVLNSKSGFSVKSPDEDLARIMHENLFEVLPRVAEEILTFLEYGAYYAEVTWEPTSAKDYGLDKEYGMDGNKFWWVISDFHGCHPSTIKEILRDEKTKRFRGFRQELGIGKEDVDIGLDRALIIPHGGVFGNVTGTSILEPVYVWWFWFELVWRAFLRFLQRQGVGVVLVRAPSQARVTVAGRTVSAMDWALQLASSLHKTNFAVVPSDTDRDTGKELWTVEFVTTGSGEEGKQFVEALKLLADNIKLYLLTGSTQRTEGDELDIMLDTERILSHITMHITRYVLRRAIQFNGSTARKLVMESQGANTRILPLLFKLMAVAGNTAGDALRNVDWRSLFAKGGVPILTEEEVEKIKEEAMEQAKEIAAGRFAAKAQSGQDVTADKGKEDEKAKLPRGGEGRWASQRDKEGKPEKMSMSEALNIALSESDIVLSPDQVATVESLGLRHSDDIIVVRGDKIVVVEGQDEEEQHAGS